jgi:hypothetical protein
MGIGGLLARRSQWSIKAFEETFRGPRGLREGVVQDLERLYRLRWKVFVSPIDRLPRSWPGSPSSWAGECRACPYFTHRRSTWHFYGPGGGGPPRVA